MAPCIRTVPFVLALCVCCLAGAEPTTFRTIPADADGPVATLPTVATGAAPFTIDLPRPSTGATVSVADHGASTGAVDNGAAFNRAIAHCKTIHASTLVIPAGTYRFTANDPIDFQDLEDVTVDGRGSTLVFLKERGDLIHITGCRRTLFKDLSIDWDWTRDPIASTVRVEALAADHLDLRFLDPVVKRDLRVADLQQLDPATMSAGCEDSTDIGFEIRRGQNAPHTEWLRDDVMRVEIDPGKAKAMSRAVPGSLYRMRHYNYDMVGVVMRDNAHLTLSGITVFSCPGHAFLSEGEQHHWQFLRVRIVRPAGTTRPITCSADHHHVARSLGFLRMEDCEFSLGGDDCLNVHDTSSFCVRNGPRSVLTRNLRDHGSYHPGDPIELRQDDYAPAGFSAPLKSITTVDGAAGTYELTFANDLPAQAGSGFILFNRRYGSRQVVVRNCFFHDNKARGLLLLGSDMTIEGNRFRHNQKCAIKIETGYTFSHWSEGYGAANIVIRNNRFETINPMGAYPRELTPAIYLSTYLRTDPSAEKARFPILHDILVEGNAFVDCPGAIVNVCSARNVVVRGNTVENPTPRRQPNPFRGWVGASYADGIYVTGNTWNATPVAPPPGVRYDADTCGGIHCWGNTIGDRHGYAAP